MACSTNRVYSLSWGSLQKILDGVYGDSATLQILGYKRVPGEGDRFRLLLNDGTMLFSFAILATHLNSFLSQGKLEKFSVFELKKFHCTEAPGGKKIIVLLDIAPIKDGCYINSQISLPSSEDSTNNKSEMNSYQIPQFSGVTMNSKINIQSINNPSSSPEFPQLPKKNDNVSISPRALQNESFISSSQKSNLIPISSLNPYLNKWTTRARIIYKSPLIEYSNSWKKGKLLSFYLVDETEEEIRAAAFDSQAEHYNEFIQLNKIYYISNASIVLAKPGTPFKFDFEIKVTSNTKLELYDGEDSNIPKLKFNFTPLHQLTDKINQFVDVLGICVDISNRSTIITKAMNKKMLKLSFTLVDITNTPIFVTLWGHDATNFNPPKHAVIGIKNAKVTSFKGCSLSVSPYSMLYVNPEVKEVESLISWFQKHQHTIQLNASSYTPDRTHNWKYLSEINVDDFEMADKVEYYSVKGTIAMIQKDNCMYQACPSDDCFKKVSLISNNLYHCTKCNKDYDSFSWTLMLNLNIADFTSDVWAVAFRETAESIIGMKTDRLSAIKEENEDEYLEILSGLHFKSFIFKLRSRIGLIMK